MTEEEDALRNELEALKDQISNLKAAILALQKETDHKDLSIVNLAREKEKITLELLKTKRSHANLAQQLEDERTFYFKEKETYCQEMNECKRLKKLMSSSTISSESKTAEDYKREILKIKQSLDDTLEANYNLSIKFLRMKNTKTCVKTELKAMQLKHDKLQNDYKARIEGLTAELNTIVDEKLNSTISPSSKKYMQLLKQNSCLVYENLCLQLEVDNLNLKLDHMKLEKTRSETNSRLSYIHHDKVDEHKHSCNIPKDRKKGIMNEEPPVKLEKQNHEPQPSCSHHNVPKTEGPLIKIFERKQKPELPAIKIIDEKNVKKKKRVKRKQEEKASNMDSLAYSTCEIPDVKINIDDNSRNKIKSNGDSTKLALFQVSGLPSVVSSVSLEPKMSRSRSLPELKTSLSRQKL
ncbi:unnamed protein product [Acanthoscelides obtectus]|nr:unnamed protein product [Acanthoscelides obtectus]CAK1675300.1 hypothetical protein AOBTE_LOCUS30117 [Acanthoscelides obtectus]